MKKQEAIDKAAELLKSGTSEAEVKQVLLAEEKIGQGKPTVELVDEVVSSALKSIEEEKEEKEDKPKATTYKHVKVDTKTGETVKTIRERVPISDHQAEVLNSQWRNSGEKYLKNE